MTAPTIQQRLQKKCMLMTNSHAMLENVRSLLPDDWQLLAVKRVQDVGAWNELLLYRFLLLDLNEPDTFDPLDVMRTIRMEYQINIPVFCFGGDETVQNEMRLARADRFFSVDEMLEILPTFFEQYRW